MDNVPNQSIECDDRLTHGKVVAMIKPYVYEVVNGKRKRVSPIVIENGVVVKIHQRGIIQTFK